MKINRLSTGIIAFSVIFFTVFSIFNAMVLASHQPYPTADRECRNMRTSYGSDIAWIRAKGLSGVLNQDQIRALISDRTSRQHAACGRAALSSSVQMCAEATTNYAAARSAVFAKALSVHLTPADIDDELAYIRDYRMMVCDDARSERNGWIP